MRRRRAAAGACRHHHGRNGRWAKRRGLPRKEGHRQGAKTFRKIAEYASQIGIRYLTVYAFSTENWKRPKEEVDSIMQLLREYLREIERYAEENVRLRFLGDRSALDEDIRELMERAEAGSRNHTGMTLNIAINYGGRDELTRAVKSLAQSCIKGELSPVDIDYAQIAARLDTAGPARPRPHHPAEWGTADLQLSDLPERLRRIPLHEGAVAGFYTAPFRSGTVDVQPAFAPVRGPLRLAGRRSVRQGT